MLNFIQENIVLIIILNFLFYVCVQLSGSTNFLETNVFKIYFYDVTFIDSFADQFVFDLRKQY